MSKDHTLSGSTDYEVKVFMDIYAESKDTKASALLHDYASELMRKNIPFTLKFMKVLLEIHRLEHLDATAAIETLEKIYKIKLKNKGTIYPSV